MHSQLMQEHREPQWRDNHIGRETESNIQARREKSQGLQSWTKEPKKEERAGLGGMFNLTDVILTHRETNLLNLGLKCGLKRPINTFYVFYRCTQVHEKGKYEEKFSASH